MPRWIDIISTNTTIHHSTSTATADARIQDFCTAITMQCFMQSEANHAVLTTIQLGVSTMFITPHAYHERDSFHSLLTRFLWTCAAILSKILTYQLLGSQLWTALPLEKSRSPATANKVSKSRHNSRTKLRVKLSHDQNRDNIEFYLHCKFQSLPFCVCRRNGVTDRNISTKGADASVECHNFTYTMSLNLSDKIIINIELMVSNFYLHHKYPQTQLSTIPQTQQL